MRIAILGGRFDPPHIGHWLVALQTLELRPDIDKLLLIPVGQHQWKPTIAKGKDRIHMLSFFKHPRIEVSGIELLRSGISYSIDTIREIRKNSNDKIYWIVGADIIPEFDKWERKDELVKEATFLVFPRDPYHLPKNLPKGFELIADKNLITSNVSSTMLRQRIKDKKTIHGLVLSDVENYILKKGLYR